MKPARNGLSQYLQILDPLIGDRRTGETAKGIVGGILAGHSLCMNQIAAFSPWIQRAGRSV